MPRKVQITKEIILDAALKLLIREGYSAVNIKSLARELHCSTQPISWQFENMEGFRAALATYALSYTNGIVKSDSKNALVAFKEIGQAYIDLSFDMPNLYRFVGMNESGTHDTKGMLSILDHDRNTYFAEVLAKMLGISVDKSRNFIITMVTYTHGLSALITTGMVKEDRETVKKLMFDTGTNYLVGLGVERDLAMKFSER